MNRGGPSDKILGNTRWGSSMICRSIHCVNCSPGFSPSFSCRFGFAWVCRVEFHLQHTAYRMKKARNSVDFRQRDWNQGSTRPTNMEDWEVTKPHNDSSNKTTSNRQRTPRNKMQAIMSGQGYCSSPCTVFEAMNDIMIVCRCGLSLASASQFVG